MATRAIEGRVSALPAALAVILSQPRPVIDALAARLIELLDQIDGDPDREDGDEDCCPSGDDDMHGDTMHGCWTDTGPGDPDDAEDGADAEEDRGNEGANMIYVLDQRRIFRLTTARRVPSGRALHWIEP